jgi:pimeloyl-ACP methyl ester carboxylesterase
VVLGGHSLGSVDAILEASTYHDEDAVLITGLSHQPDYVKLAEVPASSYPAALDPVTVAQGYSLADVGYFTTDPGTRPALFYGPNYDPNVAAVDEATKSVYALGEPVDGPALAVVLPTSNSIDVPVLIVNGAEDLIFCNATTCASSAALRTSEATDYASSPCLSAYVLPDAGHDVNLAPDTGLYQARVIDWLGELPAQRAGSDCPIQ